MFDYHDQSEEKEPADPSGLIIGILLAPVFALVTYLRRGHRFVGRRCVGNDIICHQTALVFEEACLVLDNCRAYISAPCPASSHFSMAAWERAQLCNTSRNRGLFHHHRCG